MTSALASAVPSLYLSDVEGPDVLVIVYGAEEGENPCRCWGRNPFPILTSLMILSRDKLLRQYPKSGETILIEQLLTPPLLRALRPAEFGLQLGYLRSRYRRHSLTSNHLAPVYPAVVATRFAFVSCGCCEQAIHYYHHPAGKSACDYCVSSRRNYDYG
jgi:hypothetical protein